MAVCTGAAAAAAAELRPLRVCPWPARRRLFSEMSTPYLPQKYCTQEHASSTAHQRKPLAYAGHFRRRHHHYQHEAAPSVRFAPKDCQGPGVRLQTPDDSARTGQDQGTHRQRLRSTCNFCPRYPPSLSSCCYPVKVDGHLPPTSSSPSGQQTVQVVVPTAVEGLESGVHFLHHLQHLRAPAVTRR